MKRLLVSVSTGLVLWFAVTTVLFKLLLPATCEGCEDDLGAGLFAVVIAAFTLVPTVIGIALFNFVAWIRNSRQSE